MLFFFFVFFFFFFFFAFSLVNKHTNTASMKDVVFIRYSIFVAFIISFHRFKTIFDLTSYLYILLR